MVKRARPAGSGSEFDVDGWSSPAAEDLLDLVAGLVDKSILVRDDARESRGEHARYRMLETIRDFSAERLVDDGEEAELRRRHADWYQQLVDRSATEWISDRQVYWTARLTREHPNLRAAVEHCLTEPGRAETALHLAMTVPLSYWFNRGLFSEARSWLDHALTQTGGATTLRARATLIDSLHTVCQGDGDAGMRLCSDGEDLARQLDAAVELALASYVRGVASLFRGDLPTVVEALESSRNILSPVPWGESGFEMELRIGQLIVLGTAAAASGDQQLAEACSDEVLGIVAPRGEQRYRCSALWIKALAMWRQGNIDEAVVVLAGSLRLKQEAGLTDPYSTARCLEGLAWMAAGQQRYQRAATLLGAADAVWTEAGTRIATHGFMVDDHEAGERQARVGLGDDAFNDAFLRAQAMSYDEVVAYALDDQRQAAPPTPADVSTPLTAANGRSPT